MKTALAFACATFGFACAKWPGAALGAMVGAIIGLILDKLDSLGER